MCAYYTHTHTLKWSLITVKRWMGVWRNECVFMSVYRREMAVFVSLSL